MAKQETPDQRITVALEDVQRLVKLAKGNSTEMTWRMIACILSGMADVAMGEANRIQEQEESRGK